MTFARWAAVVAMATAFVAGALGADGDGWGVHGALAQEAAMPNDAPPPNRLPGFLRAEDVPDYRAFLPPPPAVGTPLGDMDVAVFEETRALEGSERWRLAAEDAALGYSDELQHFSCALGAEFDPQSTPALERLIQRSMADVGPMIGPSKAEYQRPRPFLTHEGALCLKPSDRLAKSGSYPSGHSAAGWLYALLLSEVQPDHAADILARGRAVGESRVVCGVHYVTDINGGRMLSTALVAALNGNAEFQSAVAEARSELDGLRAKGAPAPDAARCEAERETLQRPW